MRTLDTERYTLPDTGFLRLPQVLRVIPLGKTCLVGGRQIWAFSQAREVIGSVHRLAR